MTRNAATADSAPDLRDEVLRLARELNLTTLALPEKLQEIFERVEKGKAS